MGYDTHYMTTKHYEKMEDGIQTIVGTYLLNLSAGLYKENGETELNLRDALHNKIKEYCDSEFPTLSEEIKEKASMNCVARIMMDCCFGSRIYDEICLYLKFYHN